MKISQQTLQTLQMLQMQPLPKLSILQPENLQVPITVPDHLLTVEAADTAAVVVVDTVAVAVTVVTVLKAQTVHHPPAVIQVLHNPQTVLHQVHLNHPVKLDKVRKLTTYPTLSRFIF